MVQGADPEAYEASVALGAGELNWPPDELGNFLEAAATASSAILRLAEARIEAKGRTEEVDRHAVRFGLLCGSRRPLVPKLRP